MMKTWNDLAFAKLNLYLGVEGLRPDGYHELETVFQAIDLCDRVSLTLHRRGGISLRCNLPYLPCDERNLAFKAANLFFEKTGLENPGIHLNIKKLIPVGAGMAGGSTDAACVLRLLNRAFGMPLREKTLADAALALGADVPFCLNGGTALATGVGERLKPLAPMPECRIVVGKPAFSVSTKAAFGLFDQQKTEAPPGAEQVLQALARADLQALSGALYNSLEKPVAGEHPQITLLRECFLQNGALGARMTGSGSAVFGIFSEEECAKKAAEAAQPLCKSVFITRPLSARP